MKVLYVTVRELVDIVKNNVRGTYTLSYWNLDYPEIEPDILVGSYIRRSGNEFWLEGHEGQPFPVDPEDNSGIIHRYNNDHYQFSLKQVQ